MATIELPAPIEMQMPLVQVLGRRRSRREFSEQPLDGAILSTLLWACVGRNSDDDRRTAPSAFNCREVDCFVFDDKGVWLYDPEDNALVQATQGDKRAMTTTAQDYVGMAPITLGAGREQRQGRAPRGRHGPDLPRRRCGGGHAKRAFGLCGHGAVGRAARQL